jgi:hypothetical protein
MTEKTESPGVATILRSLLVDVGVPALAYFVAHWLGASDFVALLTGSVIALLRTLFVAVKDRRFQLFSAFMVGVFTVGLVLEALLRVPLVFLLPIEVMVTVSTVMLVAAFVLLAVWTRWYATRAQARFAEFQAAQQVQAAPTEP